MIAYAPTETLSQAWLATTPVAALVTRGPGLYNIFKAMPNAAPLPSVVLSRVGGAPVRGSDMALDTARISFQCWAANRDAAAALALAVVNACENLAQVGGFTHLSGLLLVSEVVSVLWLPDPESDTPRYVVDALFTSMPA